MLKIRVFLLDEHEIVRRGLRSLIEGEPDMVVVGEAATAREGLATMLTHRPDVALLDAGPDGSGIDVARHLSAHAPEVRSLLISFNADDEALSSAFDAGVAGYVLKRIGGDHLVQGVRAVAAGQTVIDPAVAGRMMERMRAHQAVVPVGMDSLSKQERRILELIADGLTNREIGHSLSLSEKTIKNNVTSILGKLGVQRRTQAAVLVSRMRRA